MNKYRPIAPTLLILAGLFAAQCLALAHDIDHIGHGHANTIGCEVLAATGDLPPLGTLVLTRRYLTAETTTGSTICVSTRSTDPELAARPRAPPAATFATVI